MHGERTSKLIHHTFGELFPIQNLLEKTAHYRVSLIVHRLLLEYIFFLWSMKSVFRQMVNCSILSYLLGGLYERHSISEAFAEQTRHQTTWENISWKECCVPLLNIIFCHRCSPFFFACPILLVAVVLTHT